MIHSPKGKKAAFIYLLPHLRELQELHGYRRDLSGSRPTSELPVRHLLELPASLFTGAKVSYSVSEIY